MQNQGITGITGFRTIGKFDRQLVEERVRRVCKLVGKDYDGLNESEKNIFLTDAANLLANRPTILAQTADLPNITDLPLVQFHRLFAQEMRNLPGWNIDDWAHGYPVDGVTGYGGTQTGAGVGTETQSRR